MRIELLKNHLNEQEVKEFTRLNKGYEATRDCLKIIYEEDGLECSTTYVIFKGGKFTPYMMVRDIGDYYILARYSSYLKIRKSDLTISVG